MSCTLCFEIINDEQQIDIASDEAQHLNLPFILHQHFRFCFQFEPVEGYVCRKCWAKISVFHDFYLYIESMHSTGHTVFVDCERVAVKEDIDSTDEIKSSVENAKSENASNGVFYSNMDEYTDDFDLGGHVSDESLVATTGKVKKKPTRKRKVKKKHKEYKKRKYSRRDSNEPSTVQCKVCEIHFLSFHNLERHIKELHNVKEFKCDEMRCVESFETEKMLAEHIAMSHTRLECIHCKKKIIVSYMEQHVKERHQTDNSVMCDLCGKVSVNKNAHAEHHKSAHEDLEKLECDICGRRYKTKRTIRYHLATHVTGPRTCSICGKILANPMVLVSHKRLHKPEFENRFKCIVCGKGFRYNKRLQEHSHIHTGSAGSYHCPDCGKIFRFSSSFSVHKKKMHPK